MPFSYVFTPSAVPVALAPTRRRLSVGDVTSLLREEIAKVRPQLVRDLVREELRRPRPAVPPDDAAPIDLRNPIVQKIVAKHAQALADKRGGSYAEALNDLLKPGAPHAR